MTYIQDCVIWVYFMANEKRSEKFSLGKKTKLTFESVASC